MEASAILVRLRLSHHHPDGDADASQNLVDESRRRRHPAARQVDDQLQPVGAALLGGNGVGDRRRDDFEREPGHALANGMLNRSAAWIHAGAFMEGKRMGQVKTSRVALAAIVAALVMGVASHASAQQTGKLQVTVDYKGAGTVDKTHQIFVWVFDTPDINENSVPIATDQATSNGATLSFSGLPKTVYLAAAYNEKGTFDGTQGPPPSGTPVTIYGGMGTATGVPTGGDEAKVTVTFDDSVRMP